MNTDFNEAPYLYNDEVRQDIIRLVPVEGKVLGSIGCGRGKTESMLIAQGREVHGVDVSSEAIAVAVTRLSSARVVSADASLLFERESLDGLILADVLEHMPRAWQRLTLHCEAVKPGGWVVISVPNMRHIEVLYQLVVRGDWPEHPMGVFDDTHVQVMTHRRLQRWCNDAGLELVRWSDCYDYRFFRRNIYRGLNLASLKLLRSFFTFEIQGLFRVKER